MGGRRLSISWHCGIKSGSGESRLWSVMLGSSSVLSSNTACMAQVVSGRMGGVTAVVVGCLGLRPLPYRIQIGRDLVRGLGLAGVVVFVGVLVVIVVGEVVVGVVEVVVEENGEVVVSVVGVLVVVKVGGVVVGELAVVGEVVGVVVGASVFARLRHRPYRIHMGGCLALLLGISGGMVEEEVGVEGVVTEEVEAGVVWVVEVFGVVEVVVVVVGVVVVAAGVRESRLEGLAWCSSQ